MLRAFSLTAVLRSSPLLLCFLLLLLGMGSYGCIKRRPARILPERKRSPWLPWSGWSSCSSSCGRGFNVRRRFCRQPKQCSGTEETEIKACIALRCSDDVQWTSWSLCSSTCGLGWKTRSQPCDQNSCQEFSQEKKRCNVGPCPIDGGLSEWGPWSSCSVTCGVGTETRLRTCSKPPPQFGGADCRDPTTSKRTCSLTTCRPKVISSWSAWSSWDTCSRTCGEGVKSRSRQCKPSVASGGTPCPGQSKVTKPCVMAVFCGKPVHGQWGAWDSWTVCAKQCSGGTRSRLRFCNSPEPKYGGRQCAGKAYQTETCADVCVVHGGWSAWKPVSNCGNSDKPCSPGNQLMERKCDNPKPKHGGNPCKGPSDNVMKCWNYKGCSKKMQKVSDFQSQSFANKTVLVTWRQPPFGEAPTNFDISIKPAKSSNVKTVRVSAKAANNDRPFDGWRYAHTVDVSDISGSFELWIVGTNKAERVSSNTQSLIVGEVDGSWSAWDSWSACPVTCGSGIQTRNRRCDAPTRSPKGRPCRGKDSEKMVCDRGFC